jgi:hypothetical protein
MSVLIYLMHRSARKDAKIDSRYRSRYKGFDWDGVNTYYCPQENDEGGYMVEGHLVECSENTIELLYHRAAMLMNVPCHVYNCLSM